MPFWKIEQDSRNDRKNKKYRDVNKNDYLNYKEKIEFPYQGSIEDSNKNQEELLEFLRENLRENTNKDGSESFESRLNDLDKDLRRIEDSYQELVVSAARKHLSCDVRSDGESLILVEDRTQRKIPLVEKQDYSGMKWKKAADQIQIYIQEGLPDKKTRLDTLIDRNRG